tara:strand:+ start:343 stop:1116 length:774 start_codon:yes stop_codon:yes gene_type:complete
MEAVGLETQTDTATRDKLQAWHAPVEALAVPLFNWITGKAAQGTATKVWNQKIFNLVKVALESEWDVAELYSYIVSTLPNHVAKVGQKDAFGPEDLQELRDQAENGISQLSQPFWGCSHIVKDLHEVADILRVMDGKGAKWANVVKHVRERTGSLAFAPERAETVVHYTPRGGKTQTFTVGRASATRDDYKALLSQAAAMKEDNSVYWSAVERGYRTDNPAGMVDRRTKADRDQESLDIGRAIQNKISPEQIAALLK